MLKLKTALTYLFVNWWWGFWKRKPKKVESPSSEDNPPPRVIEDLIQEHLKFQSEGEEGGYLVETKDGLFHGHWKKLRMIIFSCDQEKKVDSIKALRRATGAGLKEAKHVVDDLEEMPAFIGPFKNTPEFVLKTLQDAGFLVLLLEVDWDDGEVAPSPAEQGSELIELWDDLNDGSRWYDFETEDIGSNTSLFLFPLVGSEANEEYWGQEFEEEDFEEAPEEILFGHEDHELTPND